MNVRLLARIAVKVEQVQSGSQTVKLRYARQRTP